jgi:hypothetical protein
MPENQNPNQDLNPNPYISLMLKNEQLEKRIAHLERSLKQVLLVTELSHPDLRSRDRPYTALGLIDTFARRGLRPN